MQDMKFSPRENVYIFLHFTFFLVSYVVSSKQISVNEFWSLEIKIYPSTGDGKFRGGKKKKNILCSALRGADT